MADTVQSKAELLEKLGRRKNGGSYTFLCRKIRQLGVDISHFRDPKDRSNPLRGRAFSKIPVHEVFVQDRLKGYREGSAFLKRCMLEYGFELHL